MAATWTPERISKLTLTEVKTLGENAKARGNEEVFALCEAEIMSRKPKPSSNRTDGFLRAARSALAKKLEVDAVDLLVQVANQLEAKYDLSQEKARQLSEGTKRFIPHRLTDSKGSAKVGGAQKSGVVVFDRYISYRLKDEIYALIALLYEGDDMGNVVYQVIGPKSILTNAAPINEQRAYLKQDESIGLAKYAENFNNFSDAAERYKFLMEHVAPKR